MSTNEEWRQLRTLHFLPEYIDLPGVCIQQFVTSIQEFLVSLALISNLNGHKSVKLSHVKCKILTYFVTSFICFLFI